MGVTLSDGQLGVTMLTQTILLTDAWTLADETPAARPAKLSPFPTAAATGTAPARSADCPEDLAWLARVRAGDEEAARALVQRLYPTVLRSIRRHLPRFTTEEDLAQTVFGKIFAKLDQFSGMVPLEHWVSRITINTCISQLSRERGRPELRMSDLTQEEEAVVEHLVSTEREVPVDQSHEARELLEKLLADLKPDERLVITLLHLEEWSTERISQYTGWPVSRIKVKAFRARHKLRGLWKRLLLESEALGRQAG